MKNQAIKQTQFNEIKNKISNYATSKTVKNRIENFEPSSILEDVLMFQKETGEGIILIEQEKSIPFMASEDIDRILRKIEEGFILEPKELLEISEFLATIRKMKLFFDTNKEIAPTLYSYSTHLKSYKGIEEKINLSIQHNQVTSEASRELKKVRQQITRYESDIRDKLNKFLVHPSNKSKIQEFMTIEREGVLTIPLKSSFKHSVKGSIISESSKGATAFIQLDTTKELNQKWQLAQAEEISIIYQILAELTEEIAKELEGIKKTIEIVFSLEMIVAKAKYSVAIGGQKVSINNKGKIHLIEAKHPLLGKEAVPLTVNLGEQERGLIITGSNSGGKTVVLKTIGLLTFMTMMGVFIPASKSSEISIFEHVLVDIGDYQDFENALSTFSGHMNNMAEILTIANSKSLVLVDEIGTGTEPSEGAAIAIAILETLIDKGSVVLASTHYGEIKEFAVQDTNFLTAAMAFDMETLEPLYQLLMNQVGASNGFFIADKMNLGSDILAKAYQHFNHFNVSGEK